MRLHRTILLLAIVASAAPLWAQSTEDKLRQQLADTRVANATLQRLVDELSALSDKLNADLAVERLKAKKIRQDKTKAVDTHNARAMEYKLAIAENKMLKARIKSLMRSRGAGSTRPADNPHKRKSLRSINIELHENLWKWWSDPILLSEHISLRRKLTHLDVDHSLDAWLTRNRQFVGTKVNWTMKLVSAAITPKKRIDAALRQAEKDLSATLQAAVYGNKGSKPVDNARYKDATVAALASTQPKPKSPRVGKQPKAPKTDPYARPKQTNFRKQIRDLQERIELYKLASAAGGLTTVYAVSGDIAAKIAIPGRHFETVSRAKRPGVKVVGDILRAAPKAGYFIGRTDSMMQFELSGRCELKALPADQTKSK
jgi:hypothetical protein